MKYYILTLMMLVACVNLNGQEETTKKETKKVVVVKKVIDENGQVTEEKTEASGAEADKLIEKMKKDGDLEGIDIDIEVEKGEGPSKKIKMRKTAKDITVEKKKVDGKEVNIYKIVTEEDGDKNVMIWHGEGEMPAEMKEVMKDIKISETEKDGHKMIFIEADDVEADDQDKTVIKMTKEYEPSPNKVSMGIMIADDSKGILVDDVKAASSAENAGIQAGDIILKVGKEYVFNTNHLLSVLSKFEKGEKTKITFIRNGKEKEVKLKF